MISKGETDMRQRTAGRGIAAKGMTVLLTLMLFASTVYAGGGEYRNVFYAVESGHERHYAQYADEVSLGWGEVMRVNGEILYTNQGRTYRIPSMGGEELIKELRSQGNRLNQSVFLDDPEILKEILDDPALQERLINEILGDRRVFGASYDGIVIDFESLTDRLDGRSGYGEKLTDFIQKLREAQPEEEALYVAVHPKRRGGVGYYDGYDYKALGEIADGLIVMAHDYHVGTYNHSRIIPASAPYPLVKESIELALETGIDPEKLILGVSINPVQWRETSEGLRHFSPTYQQMINALEGNNFGEEVLSVTPREERFDEQLKVGYGELKRSINGTVIEDRFYFETPKSLKYKEELVQSYGLKGMSVWRLGIGSSETLDGIFRKEMFDVNRDGRISSTDLRQLAEHYGRTSSHSLWDSRLDYNRDGKIDLLDLARLARFVPQEEVPLRRRITENPVVTVVHPPSVTAGEEYQIRLYFENVKDLYALSLEFNEDDLPIEILEAGRFYGHFLGERTHWDSTRSIGDRQEYFMTLMGNPNGIDLQRGVFTLDVRGTSTGPLSLSSRDFDFQMADPYGMAFTHEVPSTINPMEKIEDIQRLAGRSRYGTAAEVAKAQYPAGADRVILARGDSIDGVPQIADALAASSLAGNLDAPILITGRDRLPEETKEALSVLNPSRIYLMGGEAAISKRVADELEGEVVRISGQNREATAVEIAKESLRVSGEKPNIAYLVQGTALADALAVGTVANETGNPLLLVRQNLIPDVTVKALKDMEIEKVYLIGGTGVISEEVEKELRDSMGLQVARVAGRGRFETSVEVAETFWPGENHALVGNGITMVDAVAASILKRPLIFVRVDQMVPDVETYLKGIERKTIIGGPGAVSEEVQKEILQ